MKDQGGNENGGGGACVRKTVGGGGAHDLRVDLLRHLPIKEAKPKLDEDGYGENYDGDNAEFCLLGVEDLGNRAFEKLKADQKDQEGNGHGGHVFDTGVSEGMVTVGRLCGKLEADKGDDLRARVRQIVDCVCHHGDSSRERARKHLAGAEKKIEKNAHNTHKGSVLAADVGVGYLGVILDKPLTKKIGHEAS